MQPPITWAGIPRLRGEGLVSRRFEMDKQKFFLLVGTHQPRLHEGCCPFCAIPSRRF